MKHSFLSYVFIIASLSLFSNTELNKSPMAQNTTFQTITLGAGCYWCVEAIFSRLNGVEELSSGFSGGHMANPSYKEVCTGNTGHAEVAHIKYNPELISFIEILEVFFKTHDPTTLNRQGGDIGTQYRSVIFYHSDEQKELATKLIQALNKEGIWEHPIVTEISPFEIFYPAENYHQEYYENNASQNYCKMVIQPKVEKFEKLFKEKLK